MNPNNSNVELALRDIHLPDSILWWPLAPGWWILLILLVLIGISLFIYKKTWLNRQLKKSVKNEFTQCYQSYKNQGDAQLFIQQLSALLRRVSLYKFEQQTNTVINNSELHIAKLQGVEWLNFLDSKMPSKQLTQSKNMSFKTGVGKIFLSGPYQKIVNEDLSSVHELVNIWLTYNLKNKYRFM